jgi:A/G-specific adenine glycosylase
MHGAISHFRRRLLRWYSKNRRDLPWRVSPLAPYATPDPWHVLISEAMLQQTQVSTVIPYFNRFVSRFPTIKHLAIADEQEVLRLWQGLGYYSRARNLHTTSKMVVKKWGGTIPRTVEELLSLPGIGRYTAGAIASLAYDVKAPILDGNVIRVMSRLDLLRADPRLPEHRERLWRRAEEILPDKCVGDFNSALMELGATICTPRAPKCLLCPVKDHCAAMAAGVAEQIPPAPAAKVRPIERRWTIAIQDNDQWLIEQRPARGRWASMWQFVTIEATDPKPTAASLSRRVGLKLSNLRHIGALRHDLTHRRYEFEVLLARLIPSPGTPGEGQGEGLRQRRWVGLDGLSDYPLPRPQLRVAQMISSLNRP